jgi:hypothetical protein
VQASGIRMKRDPVVLLPTFFSYDAKRDFGFRTWIHVWFVMTSPFHVQSTWMLRLILYKGSINHSAANNTGVLVRREMLVRSESPQHRRLAHHQRLHKEDTARLFFFIGDQLLLDITM